MMETNAYLYLSDKNLPEIKNWKPGEKYMLVLEVEMKSLNYHEEQQGEYDMPDIPEHFTADFEIEKVKTMENMDYEKAYKFARSGK